MTPGVLIDVLSKVVLDHYLINLIVPIFTVSQIFMLDYHCQPILKNLDSFIRVFNVLHLKVCIFGAVKTFNHQDRVEKVKALLYTNLLT